MKRAASRSALILLLFALTCAPHEPAAVRDDLNRPVSLPPNIRRVITLAPNLTEMLFAVGAADRIAGTDDFSDEPAAAKRLPKVGGMQPNIEKIVSLKPDLVLATTSGNQPNLSPALAAVHIPLFVVRTDRLDEIPAAMERIAALLHAPGANAAQELRVRIAQQKRRRARPPRVLFAVWADPLYVAGRKTFSDDLLVLAGAQNAVQLDGWPQYSMESLVANPPDIILYPSKPVSRAQLEKLLDVAPALKERIAIVGVDENLFTRPGPRVAEAAARLNQILDQWERAK
ncbi:MAG TPA: helical backbone metal receptor [Thermoanaerobaculia bacterium]|nr:helical backbone metal receptor [Thermoanaerobaculia bacterium]